MTISKEPRKRPGAELTHLGTEGKDYTVPLSVFMTAFFIFIIAAILWKNGIIVFGGIGCG